MASTPPGALNQSMYYSTMEFPGDPQSDTAAPAATPLSPDASGPTSPFAADDSASIGGGPFIRHASTSSATSYRLALNKGLVVSAAAAAAAGDLATAAAMWFHGAVEVGIWLVSDCNFAGLSASHASHPPPPPLPTSSPYPKVDSDGFLYRSFTRGKQIRWRAEVFPPSVTVRSPLPTPTISPDQ